MTMELSAVLLRDISRLYNDADDYNVSLQVGEEPNIEVFKAHSVILRARSLYFRAALSTNWGKTEAGVFVFKKPNISPNIFRILLKYIYTGLFLTDESDSDINLIDLLIAADELSLIELADYIQKRIIRMSREWFLSNGVHLLNTISRYKMFKILQEHYDNLMIKDPNIFFECEDFDELNEEDLLSLIKQDNLHIEEISIWDRVIKWGLSRNPSIRSDPISWTSDDYEALQKTIHRCIPHIRFIHMSPADYFYKIRPVTRLLSKELDDDIASHFIIKDNQSETNWLPPRKPKEILESEIIDTRCTDIFSNWIDRKALDNIQQFNQYSYKLLLRGSRDGFDVETFKSKCFDKGATIIVIKLKGEKKVIGGYNPVRWSGSEHYIITTESFLFSIPLDLDPTRIILSRVVGAAQAIADSNEQWVGFGDSDLYIFRKICEREDYEFNIIDNKSFDMEDYEVFQVIKA
ncbi:14057_t:CDS:2 [Acaulospora morrowiae]|uniref:14057_t:CDS:1 n=1 Tax=Acaulospora morrowiae TaxID=94023 RepID=A0A9N9HKF4_9GLOM|nr:14057_t:CDS:2 [Acaulospora morrowiae]